MIRLFFLLVVFSASAPVFAVWDDPHHLQVPSRKRSDFSAKLITSTFGEYRFSRRTQTPHFHAAVDFGVNEAAVMAAHPGWIVGTGKLGGIDADEYAAVASDDSELPIFRTRYVHCKLRSGFYVGKNVTPYDEIVRPLTQAELGANYDGPHLHFEVTKGGEQHTPGEYGNPLYNNVFFIVNWSTGQVIGRIVVDLFQNGLNGFGMDRGFLPLTNGLVDHYYPLIRGVAFQEVATTRLGNPAVRGGYGPILKVGDQGINERIRGQGNTATVYRAEAHVRKTGSDSEWILCFLTAFDHFKQTERTETSKVFAPGTVKAGNKDHLYMYKSYGGLPHSLLPWFHPLLQTYDQLPEGANMYKFLVMGYEDRMTDTVADPPVAGTDPPYPPGHEEDEYSTDPITEDQPPGDLYSGGYISSTVRVIVDNDQTPDLKKVRAYRKGAGSGGSWTLVYAWNNGVATVYSTFEAHATTRFYLEFSEDGWVDSAATRLRIGAIDYAPSRCETDPDRGAFFGHGPNPFGDPLESCWMLEFAPTGAVGAASLQLSATDLADNVVSVSAPVSFQFVETLRAERWSEYE